MSDYHCREGGKNSALTREVCELLNVPRPWKCLVR